MKTDKKNTNSVGHAPQGPAGLRPVLNAVFRGGPYQVKKRPVWRVGVKKRLSIRGRVL